MQGSGPVAVMDADRTDPTQGATHSQTVPQPGATSPPGTLQLPAQRPPTPLPNGLRLTGFSTLPPCAHTHCLELPLGTTVAPLGIGGGALVYPATYYGRPAAAKVIQDGSIGGGENNDGGVAERRWLDRELLFLPYLSHDNVVAFRHYAHLPQRGVHVMVMERLSGSLEMTLRRMDRDSVSLTAPAFLRIAADVAVGLAYVHSLGLVHADIKPHNILMTHPDTRVVGADGSPRLEFPDTSVAKLADFAVCLDTNNRNESVDLGHTPRFLAPECRRMTSRLGNSDGGGDGRRTVQAATHPSPTRDMFALGMVLYELLIGVPQSTTSRSRSWTALTTDGRAAAAVAAAAVDAATAAAEADEAAAAAAAVANLVASVRGHGGTAGAATAAGAPSRIRLVHELPRAVELTCALLSADPAARPTASRVAALAVEMFHRAVEAAGGHPVPWAGTPAGSGGGGGYYTGAAAFVGVSRPPVPPSPPPFPYGAPGGAAPIPRGAAWAAAPAVACALCRAAAAPCACGASTHSTARGWPYVTPPGVEGPPAAARPSSLGSLVTVAGEEAVRPSRLPPEDPMVTAAEMGASPPVTVVGGASPRVAAAGGVSPTVAAVGGASRPVAVVGGTIPPVAVVGGASPPFAAAARAPPPVAAVTATTAAAAVLPPRVVCPAQASPGADRTGGGGSSHDEAVTTA